MPKSTYIKKNKSDSLLLLLLLSSTTITFYPVVQLLIKKWASNPDYNHVVFVIPVVFYIFWKERFPLIQNEKISLTGFALLFGAIALYLSSLVIEIPTLIFASAIFVTISAIFFLGGAHAVKSYSIPILLLIMLIPIPGQILALLTATLQLKISAAGETIIRTLGVPMYREGNIIHVQNISFQVVEACSGIRSLISLSTLSIILGYFSLKRKISIIALLLLSIPVAIAINLIRVVSLVLAFYYFKIDFSTGAPHTTIGLILFMFGFILLFSGQKILETWEQKREIN